MKVVFAGTPDVARPSLEALLASSHEVVGCLTRPDARAGRGRRSRPSPVREAAEAAGVPVLAPSRLRDDGVREQLEAWAPDVCAVVAYGALVPPELLSLPRHGWVNLHFSLLPAWRGAAPVQHAVMAGDEVTGAVTFVLEEGLDTGPVLGRLTETVRPRDTSGDLLGRLATAGAGLLVASFDALERGELVPEPQPAEGVSLAPKIEVEDARVDWTRPAFAVDRLVRGCTPAPGAWTTWRGERLKVLPVDPAPPADAAGDDLTALAPGELVAGRREVLVGTGTAPVRLGKVQPHGKKVMAASDWARGVRPEPGERFDG
ncbi:methionyl-tRNA formyltransferase [Ornithinimicrobium pekingense]|uniref:Methionyl-tRNA formyltransferase n=1 Tax=Ornithinimicrobium pekingense TaxID=384677 RepID=A0ABQ2FC26_9MICO|nr:methionyl-tRNA formyltransferase [Ornithinimicrobium pekingense]GGK74357.1 methionyl-tRNA formyltransferase [Ornithinimicrobium pekingense]